MIPLELTIQGLYSYQSKQTIDFKKLTAANLFGIFGTVGSGKSSILEAITYAIYGNTTRLNNSGDNRNYNMMNLKSNELLIDFTFEAGSDSATYRATVKGKRNSKNFDEVKTFARTAYRKSGNAWIPVEMKELETAIGLSYDNFRRTIIIPQGKFQEFLQLGNKERTQMMKELFNLGKYEFFHKVASLEAKNNAGIQNIEGQLQQLGEVDAGQEKELVENINQLKTELEKLQIQLQQHQLINEELKGIQQLTERINTTRERMETLKLQEPEISTLEKTVKDFEYCRYHFKHLLDNVASSSGRIKDKEQQIIQQEKAHEKLTGEYKSIENQLLSLKPAYDQREINKQKAAELGLLMKIRNIEAELSRNEVRLNNGLKIQNETTETIGRLRNEKETLEQLVKSRKQNLPDLNVLSEIRAWHIQKAAMDKELGEALKQLGRCRNEKLTLEKELQEVRSDAIFTDHNEVEAINDLLRIVGNHLTFCRQNLKSLGAEASELEVRARMHQFAGELHDGKACPLCGSLSHPQVYTAANIKELQDELKARKDKVEQTIDDCQTFSGKLNLLDQRMKAIDRDRNHWQAKHNELTVALQEHQDAFVWDKYKSKDETDAAFKEAAALKKALENAEKDLEKNNKTLDIELANKERYQKELDKLNTSITTNRAERKTLLDHLIVIDPDHYAGMESSGIEQEKKSLEKGIADLEVNYINLNKLAEENRQVAAGLEGGLDALCTELQREKVTLNQQTTLLNERLEQSVYPSVEAVKEILNLQVNVEKERERISKFREQQSLLIIQYEQLLKDIGDRKYDPGYHTGILAEIEKFGKQAVTINQEVGRKDEMLDKLRENLKNRKRLNADLDKLKLRAENIKTMKSLFKASGFVNYISSVYLQNLCNAANERFFQLTRQKLSLEMTADNNFQVRDFMNGGKVRNVKTLSGGQTFQASLSLALALADNIQKINESDQNFFFLDEGFGSLDKESLSVVFDTLKTLRKENRVVGVISHVEEMQQEIDMHLRIENHEEKGSIIKPCWIS